MSEIKPDVSVENNGSLFLFTLHTDAAKTWVDDYVEVPEFMWLDDECFAAEHRLARDLAEGMQSSGLVVT